MAEVILPAVAASAAKGVASAAFTLAAVNFGISAVASYAVNALTPKPELPGQGGFLVNEVNPTAPAEYVYGEMRKGGVVTYDETTDSNDLLHRIIVLGAGEYEVTDIYLNDEIVTLSDNSFSLEDPSSSDGESWEGAGWILTDKWTEDNTVQEPRIRILVHDGSQTATTDTFANSNTATLANTLIADSENGLDSNFVGNGLCYLYVYFIYDAEGVFAGGIPRITAKIKRKNIYDPRDDTNKATSNWALCVADYLQSDEGLGDTGSVDNTDLQVQANICAETIALDAGGTQRRYQMNGVFRADEQPGQILSKMMPSGSGQLFWGQGKWNIRAGDYAGSVASFGLDDLRSGIQVETRAPRSQNYNAIRGVFNDKSQRYIEGEYPRIASPTFIAEDGGFENALDYDLPFETDGIRAQRLAKLALFRQREQIRVEADFNMRAASVQPGDVIDLTIDRYGWTAKEFEVVGWTLKISESGTLCVQMSLKETSEDAFDWDAEESVFGSNNTTLPDLQSVGSVQIGDPFLTSIQNPGGTIQPVISVPWTVTTPQYVRDYVFQWRENTVDYSSGFVTLSSPSAREQLVYDTYLKVLGRVPAQSGFDYYVSGAGSGLTEAQLIDELGGSTEGQNQDNWQSLVTTTRRAEVRSVETGKRYDFRVYARNGFGLRSAYSAITYLVTEDVTAPGVPTSLTAEGGFLSIALKWTNPPDYDLSHVEIWEGDGTNINNASLIADNVLGSDYSRINLAADTQKYYWIRSVDFTGNKSAFVGPSSGITRKLETSDIGDAIIPWDALDANVENVIDSKVDALEVTVDNTYATITEVSAIETDLTLAENDITGLRSKYGVTIDNNGSITGFQLLSGLSGSAFNIRADQFAIFNGGGSGGDNPFTVFTSPRTVDGVTFPAGTYIKDAFIDKAAIVQASVDTLEIKGEAVTVPLAQTVADGVSDVAGGAVWKEVQWLNFTLPQDGNILVMWDAKHGYDPGFSPTDEQHFIHLAVAPSGTTAYSPANVVRAKSGRLADDYPTMLWEGSVTGGVTNRISIWWQATTDMNVLGRTLVIMGSMR